jgi:hypothetical protein
MQNNKQAPRESVAWFWFAISALLAACSAWVAFTESELVLPAIFFSGCAALIFFEPWLRRKLKEETVQIDETGVRRKAGAIREQIQWPEVIEIRIITTDEGPFQVDVFFALVGSDGNGCLIPHDAAERTGLLEELQSRFPDLDNEIVIKAMGCASNNDFLIWKKPGTSSDDG